jgi:Nucleolar complex-associated protein
MNGLKFLANVDENQLKNFPMTKGQRAAPKSKKEKKAAKKQKMRAEIDSRNGIRDEDSSIDTVKLTGKTSDAGNVENVKRQTFTKGWMDSFTEKEALPTKQKGKIVRTIHRVEEENSDEGEKSEEEGVVFPDGFRAKTYPDVVNHKKAGSDDEDEEEDDDDDEDYEFEPDLEMDRVDEITETSILATKKKSPKAKPVVVEKIILPGDENSQRGKKASAATKFLDAINTDNARNIIGDICTTITADPEKSFKKKRDFLEDGETPAYNFADLLTVLSHPNKLVVELAMLSCLLAFKDILPGYRIRPTNEAEKDVLLKKETKRLRDYENAILGAYQRYLKFLDTRILSGLRNPKKAVNDWDVEAKLGLSALRCQCELLRAVPHFNYRTLLLNAVVSRAAQPENEVSDVCCSTLEHLFKSDNNGEASYEAVRLIGQVIMASKYDVPAGLIKVLSAVKLRVHADQAKGVRRKVKNNLLTGDSSVLTNTHTQGFTYKRVDFHIICHHII